MAEQTSFAQVGRIEAIRMLFRDSGYEPFNEPLWFSCTDGAASTSSGKMLLEGVDFNLVYFPLKHLGYKAVIEATGELYAVMAQPRTLSIVLGISAKLDFKEIQELWSGILCAAHEHGYKSLSLDLQPSKNGLSISVNACGEASAACCSHRPKAQSKDLICVSGSLGAAYLGMQLLERESKDLEKNKMLLAAYLKPELPVAVPTRLEESGIFPSFGYFINRGLSDAVLRLTRDSGLGAKIYADKIPFEGNSFAVGKELDIDPISAAMNGGDDCQILFTVPILQLEKFRHDFQAFDIIGHLAQPEAGTTLVTPDGVELPLRAQGWNLDN